LGDVLIPWQIARNLGDNFVVNVEEGNEEGIEFYVMLCTQPTHILKEDYTCHWGT